MVLRNQRSRSAPSRCTVTGTLECELLDRRRFRTQAEARMAVFDYLEGFYNPRRRHSALDYKSPMEYEKHHALAA